MPDMTPAEFRDRLAALGLSQQAFGRLARVDARTVQRWALGERVIPGTVETILDLLDAAAEKPEIAAE